MVLPANTLLWSQAIEWPSSFSFNSFLRLDRRIPGMTTSTGWLSDEGTLTVFVAMRVDPGLPMLRPSVSWIPSSETSSEKKWEAIAVGGGFCISLGKKLRGYTLAAFRKLSGISYVSTPSSVTRTRRRDPRMLSSTRINFRFFASGISGKRLSRSLRPRLGCLAGTALPVPAARWCGMEFLAELSGYAGLPYPENT